MPFKLDHIVIAVHDLAAAIDDYTALGFHVQRGGEHRGRPTHNALVVFEDGVYFELVAWKQAAPDDRWWQLLQRHGEGIVDYALLPSDTLRAVSSAALRGLLLDGPHDGGRIRPDGVRLRWQTARSRATDLPFLCGDLTPRALRVPEGDARVHPNGALGVTSLAIAVEDVDATLARFHALFGDAVDDPATRVGEPVSVPAANTRVVHIALGSSVLVLHARRQPRVHDEPQGSALAQRLESTGEGPYALVLQASDARTAGSVDAVRAHGAAIEFDPPSRDLRAQFRASARKSDADERSVQRSVGG